MWKTIKNELDKLPYFGPNEVGQLLDVDNGRASQMLARWVKSERVMRLKRGYYMTREFYLKHKNELGFVEMIASIVQPSSYLSREYVLQKYGVMTESVYLITGVTSKNTQRETNQIGSYEFRHIKPSLYGGYSEKVVGGIVVREASPAKSLFDYLYLRRGGWLLTSKNYNLIEDLRLNILDWREGWKEEFADWVEKAGSRKMSQVLDNLRRSGWE